MIIEPSREIFRPNTQIQRPKLSDCFRCSPLGLGIGLGGTNLFSETTPLSIFAAALKLWLRADLGITLATGKVSEWTDQSGAGNVFGQATDAQRPPHNASDANLAGQASVGPFTGSGPRSLFATTRVPVSPPWTLCVMAYNTTTVGGVGKYPWSNNDSHRADVYQETSKAHFLQSSAGGGPDLDAGAGTGDAGKLAIIVIHDNAGNNAIYVNAVTVKAQGAAASSSTLLRNAGDAATIGAYAGDRASDTYNYQGYVAEIFALNRAATSDDRLAVWGYFSARYGVSIGA